MSVPVASVKGKLPVEAGKCGLIKGHAGCTSVGILWTDYRVERLTMSCDMTLFKPVASALPPCSTATLELDRLLGILSRRGRGFIRRRAERCAPTVFPRGHYSRRGAIQLTMIGFAVGLPSPGRFRCGRMPRFNCSPRGTFGGDLDNA